MTTMIRHLCIRVSGIFVHHPTLSILEFPGQSSSALPCLVYPRQTSLGCYYRAGNEMSRMMWNLVTLYPRLWLLYFHAGFRRSFLHVSILSTPLWTWEQFVCIWLLSSNTALLCGLAFLTSMRVAHSPPPS